MTHMGSYPNYNVCNEKEVKKLRMAMILSDMQKYFDYLMRFIVYLIGKDYKSFSINDGPKFLLPNGANEMNDYSKELSKYIIPWYLPRMNDNVVSLNKIYSTLDNNSKCAVFGSKYGMVDSILLHYNNEVYHYEPSYRYNINAMRGMEDEKFHVEELFEIMQYPDNPEMYNFIYINASRFKPEDLCRLVLWYNPSLFYIDNVSDDKRDWIYKQFYCKVEYSDVIELIGPKDVNFTKDIEAC